MIVPAKHRSRGCLPAEQFIPQLMDLAGEPYYFALLSAAERYGAAHQRPQVVQVMARKNRAAIECGQVRVEFVARHDLERVFVREFNTPRGVVRYSTPEVTALELVGYPKHAGGIANVAAVLPDLAEEMEADALSRAAGLSPVSWSQRLGYLLERLVESDLAEALAPFVGKHARSYTPFAPGGVDFRSWTRRGLETHRERRHRTGHMIPRDYITSWRVHAPWATDAIEWFESWLWPDGEIACMGCGSVETYRVKSG